MTLLSLLTFLPTVILGTLVVHIVWAERSISAFLLKFSLGTGLGLGVSSLLYFLTLQTVPGRVNMLILQGFLLVVLLLFVYRRDGLPKINKAQLPAFSWLQWGFIIIFIITVVVAGFAFTKQIIARPQGALDAWSIWNRAARFIHRDPENWQATLSPELAVLRHADYPLLIPLNVAWGWDVVGNETLRIPMMQAILFTFAAIFLIFGALAFTQTVGQASLASLVLVTASGIMSSGPSLVADVPVTYFILASGILMYLFTLHQEYPLLILSGFMAGLAGWTKNEGLLFIAISPFALIAANPAGIKRTFPYYFAGLLIPLMVIVYFKSMTPPNDLMIDTGVSLLEKITDPARYWTILRSFLSENIRKESIFMLFYILVMWNGSVRDRRQGIVGLVVLLTLQVLGYGGIYLITPNDLEWHLFTSQYRLFMQVIPLAIFLCFSICIDPEEAIISSMTGQSQKHKTTI